MALEHRKIAKKFAVRRINRLIAEIWPSTERWKPTARVPAWVGDLDLWAKCVKEVGGHGRGYGSSLTEASMKYRQQGGSIRRSPTRFTEIKASVHKALGESRGLSERAWDKACEAVDDELGMERGFSYQKTVSLKPEGPKAYYAWDRFVDAVKDEAKVKSSAKKATTLSDIPDNLYGHLNDILWERASGDGKIPDGEIGTTVDRLLRQEEINGTDRTDVEWVQWARYVDLGRKNFRE